MKNSHQTGEKVAHLASATLRSADASAEEKSLAASALAQSHTDKATSKEMETTASKVLRDEKASSSAKSLAASLVSQSTRKP